MDPFVEEKITSQTISPEKRLLPVKAKEKVFDEWAAVLRHKDEKDKLAEEQIRWQQKERQREYWNALSHQREETETQHRRKLQLEAQAEHEILLRQQEKGINVVATEKQKEQHKKLQAMEMMKNNIIEKERAHQTALVQEKNEMEGLQNHLRKLQEDEYTKLEEEKQEKARIAWALKQSYDVQNQIKKEEQLKLKALDKVFVKKGEESAAKVEQDRQRYFDHIREFQNATLAKERQFEGMKIESWEDKLHVDELRQAQYMKTNEVREKEREQKQLQQEDCTVEQKQRDQLHTHRALGKQLEDKMRFNLMEKQQEKEYAYQVKLKTLEEDQRERNRKEEQQKHLWEYRNALKAQMEAGERKKLFEGIMSEHERKVNQADISGYENMDTYKYPSFIQHKTIEVSPEMLLARKMNMLSRSDRKPTYRATPEVGYYRQPDHLVEMASKNMQDPQATIMRHNTHNRAYGLLKPNLKVLDSSYENITLKPPL